MKQFVVAGGLALAAAAMPSIGAAQSSASASPHTFTGNLTVVSDYRFRGISQTFKGPAVQGGFDYSHASGFYLGNWNSNVSGVSFPNGASIEMDFYGGWKGEIGGGVTLDVGALYYLYPGTEINGANGARENLNNGEVYLGLSWGPLTGKIYYSLTDYFGLNSNTTNFYVVPAANGGSRGTMYFNLAYSQEIMPKLTLGASVGHTRFANYGALDYTDYKVGVTYDLNGFLLGANLVGNTGLGAAGKNFYTGVNGVGTTKKLYSTTVVFSVGKTF